MEKQTIKTDITSQSKPVRAVVYDYLRDAILSGEFKVGEYLRERDLAKKLNISTTPIKEALRQLEQDGIVTTINRKGSLVADNLMDSLEEINYARSAIEGVAAGLAALKITDDEIKRLEEIIQKIKFFTNEGNREEISKLNKQFHKEIKIISRNNYIAKQIEAVRSFDEHFRKQALANKGELEKAYEEHRFILEKIKSKNYNNAEKAMRDHIRRTSDRVM